MKNRPLTLWLAIISALVAVSVLSGCTSGAGAKDSNWATPKVGDHVPAFTSASSLPFDVYQVSNSKRTAMQRADARLMSACAAEYGAQIQFTGDYLRPSDLSRSMTGIPFGTLTVAQASQYGYHAAADGSWAPVGGFYLFDASNLQAAMPPGATDQQQATIAAIAYGPSTNPNEVQSKVATLPIDQSGAPIPKGGCLSIVEKKINAPLSLMAFNNLRADLINLSLAHPAVVKAADRWSACMQASGYNFKKVPDGATSFGLTVLGPAEVKTAVTDATCTKSSHWADIFYYVLAKYEQQAITNESDVLQDVLAAENARLKALGVG